MKHHFFSEEIKEFKRISKKIEEDISLEIKEEFMLDSSILGCTAGELERIESKLPKKSKLPAAYKEFMLFGGHYLVSFFSVVELSYSDLELRTKFHPNDKNSDIYRALQGWEEEPITWPKNLFVIALNGPNNFIYYIDLTEGDNPPVYFWGEELEGGLEKSVKEYGTFSDFIKDHLRIHKELLTSLTDVDFEKE